MTRSAGKVTPSAAVIKMSLPDNCSSTSRNHSGKRAIWKLLATDPHVPLSVEPGGSIGAQAEPVQVLAAGCVTQATGPPVIAHCIFDPAPDLDRYPPPAPLAIADRVTT